MSIFNRTSLMESINEIDVEPYEGYIEPTMESVAEITAELNENMYKLNTSLYITDLLLEQRSQAGEDVEALTEAAIGDFFSKIIKKIKDMWAKIKTFFRNLFNKMEELISGGKRFINKYEKGIIKAANNKDAKWIEYEVQLDGTGIANIYYETLEMFRSDVMDVVVYKTDIDKMASFVDSMEATICKNLNAKTFGEAKEIIKKKIKGEKTGEKKTLTKESLLDRLRQTKGYINESRAVIQKQAKLLDDVCKATLSAVEYHKREVSKNDDNASNVEVVSKYCTKLTKVISFGHWLSSHFTTVYSAWYRYDISVLKAFVSANSSLVKGSSSESKDTKEDAQTESSDSLLENILEAF